MRYVYVIGNKLNWKVYVGQTKDWLSRKKGHWYGARKNGRGHLYDAMRKHGLENFTFLVLEECEVGQVDDRERFWISHFDSTNRERGYNSESGGCAHKSLSFEHRKKLSDANKGVPFTPERCENISRGLIGKPNLKNRREENPERAKAISESLRGRLLSEEHKRATSEGLKRYMAQRGEWHPSDETRRRMSKAQRIIGARKTQRALVDANHPDARPRTCSICNSSFSPKKLTRSGIARHQTKRWCSRKCALIAHNMLRSSHV